MRKMMKNFIATFLVVAIILCSSPLSGLVGLELPDWLDISIESNAATYSGTCGENLTWSFDESTGTLTISGTGDMADYDSSSFTPWESYIDKITSVVIADGVTSIGYFAFYGCTSLTDITIPNSVTRIDNYAFAYCTSLTDITIPNSVTRIGSCAFLYCTRLICITIPDSVTIIGGGAFGYCSSLTSITLPNSITSINAHVFYCCTSLKSVTIPDSVKNIGEFSFGACISLESVTIHSGVANIDNYAFLCCVDLTDLIIYNGVSCIGACAFAGCSSLTNITIPNSVTSIDAEAFGGCTKLSVIKVDDDNQYYSSDEYGVLFNKDKTTLIQYPVGNTKKSYTIPDSVVSIESYAFLYCSCISMKILENCIEEFQEMVELLDLDIQLNLPQDIICYGNLNNIVIPDTVTSIGYRAFYQCENTECAVDCNSLTDVYYTGTEEQWNKILIDLDNTSLISATIHYNYDSTCVHVEEEVPAVPATCTTAGSTAGTKCSLCGDILTSPTTIEALGHSYNTVVTELDCMTGGYITYTCSVCNYSYNDNTTISAGHIAGEAVLENVFNATCAYNGSYDIVIYCSRCGAEISRETVLIYATGHNYAIFSHYESAHPHYAVYKCECGETTVTEETTVIDDCELCNPPEEHTHTPKLVRIEPTCIVNGMEYTICEECGETLGDTTILPAGHIWSDWVVVTESTAYADGLERRECANCDAYEENVIPKIAEIIKDDESGVELLIPSGAYSEDVKLEIEEVFDGVSFQIVDGLGNVSETKIFDITTTLNGIAVQPNTTLTVRIPLPAGYDPNRTFIYHVNSETGAVENMKARYENGYLVFETNHFSHYAIVEMGEEYNYTFSIQSPSRTEIRCKDGIILHANLNGTYPEGTRIEWTSSNGNFDKSVVDDNSLKIISKDKGYTTFTATLYDADGNVLATDSVEMYSKAGFGDKIGGFFRSLFGATKIYDN